MTEQPEATGLPVDDSWTFAILTPDTLASERLDEVFAVLRAHGFVVRACRLLELDWDRMVRMYMHCDAPPLQAATGVKRGELPGDLMRDVYALMPAIVVLLTRPSGGACAALLKAKGATRPHEAAPGTVRALGEHAIFNLMHCPDDAPSAAIELPYVVGRPDAEALVRLAIAHEDEAWPLVGLDALGASLPAFSGKDALSFPHIANRLHSRVVQVMAPRLRREGRALTPLHRAAAALEREREALSVAHSAEERMRLAQQAHPEILSALVEACGAGALREGLERLAALYDVSDTSITLPMPSLPVDDVYVSPLERVAIDAHRRS